MDYILVPDKEHPPEINALFANLGKRLGLIVSGIACSGEYAPAFYDFLATSLTDAAQYMKDTLENRGVNNVGPITKDDVLDIHNFLRDFGGDLKEEDDG